MNRDTRLKQIYYRSFYRGCKETDILLGEFAKTELESLSEDELDLYEHLLDEPDWDIFNWLTGKQETPDRYAGPLLEKLKLYHKQRHMPR